MLKNNHIELSPMQPAVKSRFLGDIIHKMKNSLGGISGFASLLDRDLSEEHPGKELASRIQEHVLRLNDMVIDLMYYVRDFQPDFDAVPVHPIISEGCATVEKENTSTGKIAIKSSFDRQPVIHSDYQMCKKLFNHLFHISRLIARRIQSVSIQPGPGRTLHVDFVLDTPEQTETLTALQSNAWETIDSVEEKLSLAIIQKLCGLIHVQWHFVFSDKSMSIQLFFPLEQ